MITNKLNRLKKIDLLKKIEEAKIKQKAGNSLEANQIFQVLLKSNNDSFGYKEYSDLNTAIPILDIF